MNGRTPGDAARPARGELDALIDALLPDVIRAREKRGKIGHGPGQTTQETMVALVRRLRLEDVRHKNRAATELRHSLIVVAIVLDPHVECHDAMRDPFVAEVLLRVARLTAAGQLDDGARVIDEALAEVQRGDSPPPHGLQRPVKAISDHPERHKELLRAQVRQRNLLRDAQGVADTLLAMSALHRPEQPAWSKGFGAEIATMLEENPATDVNFVMHVAAAMARHRLDSARTPEERWIAWTMLVTPLITLANREPGAATLETLLQALPQAIQACKAAEELQHVPMLEAALAKYSKQQPTRSEPAPRHAPPPKAPLPTSRAAKYIDVPPQELQEPQAGPAPISLPPAPPEAPGARIHRVATGPQPAPPAAAPTLTDLARQAQALSRDTASPRRRTPAALGWVGAGVALLVIGLAIAGWQRAPSGSAPAPSLAQAPAPTPVALADPKPSRPPEPAIVAVTPPSSTPPARTAAQDKPKRPQERAQPPVQDAQPAVELDPEREAQQAKARLKDEVTARLDALNRDWRGIEASPGYFYFRTKNAAAVQGALIDAPSAAQATQGLLHYAQWAVPGTTAESLPTLRISQLNLGPLRETGRVTHINPRVRFFIAHFAGFAPKEVIVQDGRTGRWHLLAVGKVEGPKASFTIPDQMDASAVDESTRIFVNKE